MGQTRVCVRQESLPYGYCKLCTAPCTSKRDLAKEFKERGDFLDAEGWLKEEDDTSDKMDLPHRPALDYSLNWWENNDMHQYLDHLEELAEASGDEDYIQSLRVEANNTLSAYPEGPIEIPDSLLGGSGKEKRARNCATARNCDPGDPTKVCNFMNYAGNPCSICRPRIHTCRPDAWYVSLLTRSI